MRSILAVAIVSLVAHARPAEACSCALPGGPVSPADQATGVPRNAVLFFDTALAPATQITLTAPGNVSIALTTIQHGSFLIATPAAQLAAQTTYTVSAQIQAQTYTTTFTTGNAADTTAPAFPGIMSATPETMELPTATTNCGTCGIASQDGRISRIRMTFPDPPGDAVLLDVQVTPQGDAPPLLQEAGFRPTALGDRMLGFHGCGPVATALTPGAVYCVRVTAYDAAGNTAGGDHVSCAVAAACAPVFDEMACGPADACVIDPGPDHGVDPVSDPIGGQTGGCNGSPGAGFGLFLFALAPLAARAYRLRRVLR